MFRKHEKIVVPKDNPFLEDALDREPLIEKLTSAIATIEQPFVISINAPWGAGKTIFLEMWRRYLEKQGFVCLYFNAWETDFSEDPLVSFIGEMDDLVKTGVKKNKARVRKIWEETRSIGSEVLKRGLPLAVQLATQGLLSASSLKELTNSAGDVSKLASEIVEEKLDQYSAEKKGVDNFRENISEVAELITKSEDIQSPLVFMIDELDRCKPTYAISLLERLKHLFSVRGVLFVLALDREQLGHSIKAVYGDGMDADGYLRRFIDYEYKLPNPSGSNFSRHLMAHFDLFPIIRNDNLFILILDAMIDIYGFSLRVQEQYFTELNMIARSYPQGPNYHVYLLPYVLALKLKDGKRYDDLDQGIIDIDGFLEPLNSYIARQKNPENGLRIKAILDAWLTLFFSAPEVLEENRTSSQNILDQSSNFPKSDVYYARQFLQSADDIQTTNYDNINFIQRIKLHIETLIPRI